MRRLLLVLVWLGVSSAAAISYTVQVAALTDQGAARALLEELRAQGFPAYLVGVPTEAGQVYRLRVGTFANRAAAARYGLALERVTGLTPVPALAETDMPTLPLEPALLALYPAAPELRAEVVQLGDALALRVQAAGEAEYRLLEPGAHARPIPAWRFGALEDGSLVRVYSFALWPPEASALSDEARRAEEDARLTAVAQSLGLEQRALEAQVVRPQGGAPLLVRAERWSAFGARRLAAFGDPAGWDPGASGEGPPLLWLGGEEGAERALERLPIWGEGASQDASLQGESWRVRADGDFSLVETEERAWRALAGRPLWAQGDYLLALSEGELVLYWLSPLP